MKYNKTNNIIIACMKTFKYLNLGELLKSYLSYFYQKTSSLYSRRRERARQYLPEFSSKFLYRFR